MTTKTRILLTCLLGFIFISHANAAPEKETRHPGARDFRQGLISGFTLFTLTSVQKELKLSDDQIKKLEAYQAEQRESYRRLLDLDPKERARKLAKASVEAEKTITEILNPEQIKRFQQIMFQNDGIHQSVDAKDGVVAAALKLTDDQEEKIRKITQEMVAEREAFIKAAGGDRSKMDGKMQELRKYGDEQLMKLLTGEQKAKWKEITGAPFKVELLGSVFLGQGNAEAEKETKYLAFQIFTYGPNPIVPIMGEGPHPQPAMFPGKAVLRNYIEDIKRRIGVVGDRQTRLAVVLGHLSFDHGDAEVTKFIELGFELAIETDVAVGFHIDDSMFWSKRKDLLSDPNNLEAMDWDGTTSTGRLLNWGKEPSAAPPQMCFNSKAIQLAAQQRSALLGKAIQAGANRLQQLKRPELFAGVIAGSETQISQDFKTGKYLGYRALLNRGFTREHPPKDMDRELESVVQEWIELWTSGLAGAGVSQQKIYSHTRFLSHRAFYGDDKDITYMKRKGDVSYSRHNTYTPPPVAFGIHHRPGFSIYPQGGIFEDIYEELAKHQQTGWAMCEGTNMQPSSGPGQTGMNMETFLAKSFNHGATLVNVFAWGIGGEANRNIPFRIVTEGEESLQAYRKFLKGLPLVEGPTVASLTDRLPPKIHKIQRELPTWIEKTGNAEAAALMQKMQEQLKAKNFDEVEKIADSILKMMALSPQAAAPDNPEEIQKRVAAKVERVYAGAKKWADSGRDPSVIGKMMEEKVKPLLDAGKFIEAETELDRALERLMQDPK